MNCKNILYKVKDAINIIPKRNKNFFVILLFFLIISILCVIKYCDIPVWSVFENNIGQFFIKDKNADMTIYNICVSYIVSWLFYLIVTFLPDVSERIEREENSIALRCAIHRDTQLLIVRITGLWGAIVKKASQKTDVNIDLSKIASIEDLFTEDIINQAILNTYIHEDSNVCIWNGNISETNSYVNWYNKIISDIEEIEKYGNSILTRYKSDIPSDLFYNIFYIINENFLISGLGHLIKLISQNGKLDISLSNCIPSNNEENYNNDYESIYFVYNWVNEEYEYLDNKRNKNKTNIFKVNVVDSLR